MAQKAIAGNLFGIRRPTMNNQVPMRKYMDEDTLWEQLTVLQERPFMTAKGLEYTYRIKGHEMFVSRKDKSLTRATVMLAYRTACKLLEEGKPISGPKKLGTFGASYLYPIFQELGIF